MLPVTLQYSPLEFPASAALTSVAAETTAPPVGSDSLAAGIWAFAKASQAASGSLPWALVGWPAQQMLTTRAARKAQAAVRLGAPAGTCRTISGIGGLPRGRAAQQPADLAWSPPVFSSALRRLLVWHATPEPASRRP